MNECAYHRRPARAVRHFVEWAGDLEDQRTKPNYYPNVDKRELLGVYIAPVSGWHYTLTPEPKPDTIYDVAVQQIQPNKQP